MTRGLRHLISSGASRAQIEDVLTAPESGFVTLQQNAAQMVLDGVTTLEEINRVINAAD